MDRRRFLRVTLSGAAGALFAACGRAAESVTSITSSPATTSTIAPSLTATPETTATTSATTLPPTSAAPLAIDVISRAGWGANPPIGEFTNHTIEQITLHHTASVLATNRDAPRQIRGHQRFHQNDRGWPDIAYHFLIDADGNVYEGRPIDAVGDTGTNYDPTGHFLVACEGDFDKQDVPDTQLASLTAVVAWALDEFQLGANAVISGHRDVATTSCPGDLLYPLIADGTVHSKALSNGPSELVYLSDEQSAARVAAIEA